MIDPSLTFGICDLKKVLKAAMKEVTQTVEKIELALRGGTTGSVALVRGGASVMTHVGDSSITGDLL